LPPAHNHSRIELVSSDQTDQTDQTDQKTDQKTGQTRLP
jgi:hypothetical protein